MKVSDVHCHIRGKIWITGHGEPLLVVGFVEGDTEQVVIENQEGEQWPMRHEYIMGKLEAQHAKEMGDLKAKVNAMFERGTCSVFCPDAEICFDVWCQTKTEVLDAWLQMLESHRCLAFRTLPEDLAPVP